MKLRPLFLAAALALSVSPAPAAAQPAATQAAPEAVIQLGRWRTRWTITVDVAGAERKLLFETADAFTPDIILDGNLGLPFLRNWVMTLDLRDGRAWIRPAVQPAAAAAATPGH